METPSSTTRVTRSQTLLSASKSTINNIPVSRNIEDSELTMSKSRQRGTQQQQDRSALIDITNDSPIVGVANGGALETPLGAKQRGGSSRVKKTPGSGEALLRGQVKTLLQKVEEEAVLSKISLESRPFLQLISSCSSSSPIGLLAPTPANTPQIPNLSGFSVNCSTVSSSVTPSPIAQELLISQFVDQIFDGKNEQSSESEKSLITRSLLLDFSEKSDISDASEECSSEMSEVVQGSEVRVIAEDDDASVWSIQVNASTHEDDDNEEEEVAEDDGYYYEDAEGEEEIEGGHDDDEEEEDDGGLMLDELCEGLNNISMNEGVGGAKFEGKHTRFVYDSDDELIKEEEEDGNKGAGSSPNVLHLKGMPTPKGKHMRFSEEEEEEGH